MPAKCCVVGCSMRADRNQVKFFRFPIVHKRKKTLIELSRDRQRAWLKAINRKDLKKDFLQYTHVCSKHFITGARASIKNNLHPDCIPSLQLGHKYNEDKTTQSTGRYERTTNRESHKIKTLIDYADPDENEEDEAAEADENNTQETSCQTEEFYIEEAKQEKVYKKNIELLKENEQLKKEIIKLREEKNKKHIIEELRGKKKKLNI